MATARVVNQIMGLGVYRQNAGGDWAGREVKYKFGGNLDDFFWHVGCTPTSITNILCWTVRGVGGTIPNPSNTNAKDDIFWTALGRTVFKDLSYQGKILRGETWSTYRRVRIDQLTPIVLMNSDPGRRLLERVRNSIRHGKPVLLGLSGGGNPRHSVVAAGIDSANNIMVIDPYTNITQINDTSKDDDPSIPYASFATVNRVMIKVGNPRSPYPGFDFAYEASRQQRSYLEPNPQPGPSRRL